MEDKEDNAKVKKSKKAKQKESSKSVCDDLLV